MEMKTFFSLGEKCSSGYVLTFYPYGSGKLRTVHQANGIFDVDDKKCVVVIQSSLALK